MPPTTPLPTPTTHAFTPALHLSLYLPSTPGPHPILIFLHGGGLCTGSRTSFLPDALLLRLLSSNHAIISADHRLLPQATAREIHGDMLGLEAWILNNNKDFDLGKVSVAGLSSGFYVAALAAMSWGKIKVGKLLGVSGMVDVAGLDWTGGREIPTMPGMEIEEEWEGVWGDRMRDGVEGVERWGWFIWVVREGLFLEVLMGRHPKQIENGVKPIPKEEQDIYLPMKGEMPETLLIHGDMDQVVLLEEAKRFAEVVRERGTWAKVWRVPGGGHGVFSEEEERAWGVAAGFVTRSEKEFR